MLSGSLHADYRFFIDNADGAWHVSIYESESGQVEVTDGLKPGEDVVVQQSYVVKADIGKAGASHEH